ncbi:transcriptional regulator, LacI family [Parapedobacter luteus]|uniref:Transcriptional regulator, LacI family n=1 Tax=Parapedobacter luteus TaxID=623280 RepID=A0A1T5BFB9_9SPHI|nr:LacI family DNA-binding transcriptional regulator [Parapedobacter luteus]SKB45855.1 transcriptional regulator, LacI family [Parapedobacter luteus]
MKRITILDIAKELNITFSTVARALNDHPAISAATKQAVRETADRLGYRPNRVASSLRSGKTKIIGVLVPRLDVSFFSSVLHGIEGVMNENGYTILLFQSQESIKQEARGIETFLRSRVDGIIASISLETEGNGSYSEVRDRNIPLAFFDRVPQGLDVPAVTIDDYQGGFMATEHLIKAGYRRIVHINQYRDINIFNERLRGYLDALKQYGLPIDENLIIKGDFSLEFGRQCVRELMAARIDFDAIFTLEDFTAMGVVQELKAIGKRIPADVGIVGFANEAFTNLVSPTISTVDQCTVEMGEEVARLFLKLLKKGDYYKHKPEKIVLTPRLLVRESSSR